MSDKSNISLIAVVLSMLVLLQSVLTVAAPCAGGPEMFESGIDKSVHAGHTMANAGDAAVSSAMVSTMASTMASTMDCCEEGAYCSLYGCLSLSAVAESISPDLIQGAYSYLPGIPQADPGPIPFASLRPPAVS